jgi:methionyl-tRNA synthetase
VPEAESLSAEGKELVDGAEKLNEEVELAMSDLQFSKALEVIWNYIGLVNKYVEISKPWALAKESSMKNKLNEVLYNLVESIRMISLFILPIMPNIAAEIQKQLGLSSDGKPINNKITWGGTRPGIKVCKGQPVFPRVEYSAAS